MTDKEKHVWKRTRKIDYLSIFRPITLASIRGGKKINVDKDKYYLGESND